MALAGVLPGLSELDGRLGMALKVFTATGVLLLLWRWWRFTVRPTFTPTEPKELPYWIPFIGHAQAFFKDSEALFTYARQYFNNTREIFSLTIAGQKMYMITAPRDMAVVYKHGETLTFDGFVKDMYKQFGMSEAGISMMFGQMASGDYQQHVHLGTGVQKEQLHPGQNYDQLLGVYLRHIERQMDSTKLPDGCVVLDSGGKKVFQLRKWCAAVLATASAEAFFGKALLELDPNLLEDFHTFDSQSWKLLYQYPRMFAKPMFEAMERSTETYTRYFQLPIEERSDACHYLKTIEVKQRRAGMTDRDIAMAGQMFFWASTANPPKICFWILAHVLHSPDLLASLRQEITPAFSHHGLDINHLTTRCPLLDATFNEALRLITTASSARTVEAPTTVNGHLLVPPAKILMPSRQLHHDEGLFGPDAHTFDPYRFLNNKDLQKSPAFKPFGGGLTLCSGRFVARAQVLALAAVVLMRSDWEVVDVGGGVPRVDLTKPTLGVMDPVEGADVLLRSRSSQADA